MLELPDHQRSLQAAAIRAAQAAEARLVAMDNVYIYGRANGRPFTEDRTYDAHTRKGRVRAPGR